MHLKSTLTLMYNYTGRRQERRKQRYLAFSRESYARQLPLDSGGAEAPINKHIQDLMFAIDRVHSSRSHLDRILGIISDARHSVCASVYVLMHKELAETFIDLVEHRTKEVAVKDNKMMLCLALR